MTNYTLNGISYRAHIFTTVGATNLNVTVGGDIELLVVGGGGAGGRGDNGYGAGGGGAGGAYGQNNGANAVANTGGSGGGGGESLSTDPEYYGGRGGSGIVIVRYVLPLSPKGTVVYFR